MQPTIITDETTERKIHACHSTDAGNAEALSILHGDKLRFVRGIGWHIWNGSYWKPRAEHEAVELVKDLAVTRQHLVAKYSTDKADNMKKAIGLEASRNINSCLKLAESIPSILRNAEQLDQNPMLLNCPNGTIHLDVGILREAQQEDHITMSTNLPYTPEATAPRWEKFLQEVFVKNGEPDYELIGWLKRALGYSLTGKMTERCFFVGHGGGHNGKTTLLETMQYILGTYAGVTPFQCLLERGEGGSGQISNDIAALRGKRFVSSVEPNPARYFDEVKIKHITGQDKVSCRFLYQNYFEYYPEFKIWLACNKKPRVRGTDEAIWGRIKLIPFNATFCKGASADPELGDKLKEEAPGILAWLVQGCLDWQDHQLLDCDTVRATTRSYRTEEDALGRFLEETVKPALGSSIPVNTLWMNYNEWAEENGETKMETANGFGMEMSARGYKSIRRQDKRVYADTNWK